MEDNLRKLQLLEKEVLDFIVSICKKHNIIYWLESGTLLGAVRHKGFIPWDDDIDISMDRENYNKFEEIFKKYYMNTEYNLTFYKKDRFMKVESKKYFILTNDNEELAVWVDIFPYDYYPESNKKIITLVDKYFMRPSKIRDKKGISIYFHNLFISIRRTISKRFIRKKYFINLFISKKKDVYIGRAFESNYKLLLKKTSEIFPLIKVKFENDEYYAPKNIDLVLSQEYGNYMIPDDNPKYRHFDVKDIIIK